MRTWMAGLVIGMMLASAGGAAGAEIGSDLAERLAAVAADERIPVLVRLRDEAGAGIGSPGPEVPRAERRRAVLSGLRAAHATAQGRVASVVEDAERRGRAGRVRRFWLVNVIALDAAPDTVATLAAEPDVEAVDLQHVFSILPLPETQEVDATSLAVNGVVRIRAPLVWAHGDKGAGAVIGVIDTGVTASHPDLKGRSRGGTNSWHDEIGGRAKPYDDNGHGTHVTGTVVGRNVVASNYIGVAWQAKYVMCKAFDANGAASDADLLACMQWMADPDGDPATDDLPDAVNNSWGSDTHRCDPTFRRAVQAWRRLDIVPVFAAGNSGVPSTPAEYPEALAVGAVDRSNVVAYFSGRGPSPCEGRIYPDLVAPGTKVRSAWPTGGRMNLQGTSMATPHVSGTIALLRSARPGLSADAIISVLRATAVDLGPAGPDNGYGFGMVDAFAAFNCLAHGTLSGCTASCP